MEQVVVRPCFFAGLTCDTAVVEMVELLHGVGHPQDHGNFFLFFRSDGIRKAMEIDIVFAKRFTMVGDVKQAGFQMREFFEDTDGA